MTIGPEEVQRVAGLAALEVPARDLGPLTRELGAIVEYVGQLADLGPVDPTGPVVGPVASPLRPDQVRPAALARSLSELAPEFCDGFFVVPRLEAMEGE